MSARIQIQHEIFDTAMASQFDPPAARLAVQRRHLDRLLRHARAETAFYADRLAPVFTQDGAIDWSRWGEVPLLTRTHLLEQREDMLARTMPRLHGGTDSEASSASTGAAVTVSRCDRSADINMALVHRQRAWHGLDWSGDLLFWADQSDPALDPPDGAEGEPWGPAWLESATGRTRHINRRAGVDDLLALLMRARPRYLSTRAKYAQFLALEALRRGLDIRLDAILCFSTAVLPEERQDCMAAFGARMLATYSSTEGQSMAGQCPEALHYHVNDEAVLVELLDDAGRPVPLGQEGRVVVTQLHNFAQPIIRYDHGDVAVAGGPCACGRTLPVLQRIVGRSMHLFRFPDGRRMAPVVPDDMRRLLGADYWQIAQIGPWEIEVRYVPAPGARPAPGGLAQVADFVRARTHPQAAINIVARDDLYRVAGGKFMEFVCELEPESR